MKKLLSIFALVLGASFAQAGTLTLNCDLPTERADGSPFNASEVAKVTLYEVVSAGYALVGEFPTCTGTVSDISFGSHNYVVTITDTSGQQSAPSEVVAASYTLNIVDLPVGPGRASKVSITIE